MDLLGIPKLSWRARIIEAYYLLTNKRKLPNNKIFFTLGGPAHKIDSEFHYLTKTREFITPKQYVSVERDRAIHLRNSKIQGPTWLYGKVDEEFEKWHGNLPNKYDVGIVSLDLMCGIKNAVSTLNNVIGSLYLCNGTSPTLIIFNVLQTSRQIVNWGHTFDDPATVLNNDSGIKKWKEEGLVLMDRSSYHNKTVGKGQRVSTFETFIYSYTNQ